MLHKLKLHKTFAEPVEKGEKNFEVRYDLDRGFQKDDIVQFAVVEDGINIPHRLNYSLFRITYVLRTFGLQDGYVAFGICKLSDSEMYELLKEG